MNSWLVLVELIAQILVHNDPHKALRMCPLSGAKWSVPPRGLDGKSGVSQVCSFQLGLGSNILYNSTQGCGWAAVMFGTLYSESVLHVITVLRDTHTPAASFRTVLSFGPELPELLFALQALLVWFSWVIQTTSVLRGFYLSCLDYKPMPFPLWHHTRGFCNNF